MVEVIFVFVIGALLVFSVRSTIERFQQSKRVERIAKARRRELDSYWRKG